LYAGEGARTATRLTTQYDLMLTQRPTLQSQVELNAYGSDDAARLTGSGLSDLTLGLRLRYELRREFAPCFGVLWAAHFGDSAGMRHAVGEPDKDVSWIAGIRAWF
jgi:copper resistance protein B